MGFFTGILAWMVAGVAGLGGWVYFFGVVGSFMLLESLIGLLFPKKATAFFGGLARAMLGDESP